MIVTDVSEELVASICRVIQEELRRRHQTPPKLR
jgi:hypothetical protein